MEEKQTNNNKKVELSNHLAQSLAFNSLHDDEQMKTELLGWGTHGEDEKDGGEGAEASVLQVSWEAKTDASCRLWHPRAADVPAKDGPESE